MTEQEMNKIIESIDVDGIVENVKTAVLGILDVFNDVAHMLKKSIENGECDGYVRETVIDELIEALREEQWLA